MLFYDEMVYEMNHMNCGYEIKWSYDLRSYERNFYNCVEKPEKFRTSTGIFQCVAPESRGHGFKPRWSPEFFRLLYAIVKIAFVTAKIIASLECCFMLETKFRVIFEIKNKNIYIFNFLAFITSWSCAKNSNYTPVHRNLHWMYPGTLGVVKPSVSIMINKK